MVVIAPWKVPNWGAQTSFMGVCAPKKRLTWVQSLIELGDGLNNAYVFMAGAVREWRCVTLQRVLLSDLDDGVPLGGKDASAPRCLARPGNAATNNEWRLSPNGWKDDQREEGGLK